MPDKLVDAFLQQNKACEQLGSPFTALVCRVLAEGGLPPSAVRRVLETWPGDPTALGDAVPLRLCGALHELVLSGVDCELAEIYPPNHADIAASALHDALIAAIDRHQDHIVDRFKSPPQTNEIRRAAALYTGLLHIATLTDLPIVLSEIGASAGLNLLLDRFCYRLDQSTAGAASSPIRLEPEWRGQPPPQADFSIIERRGCDLNPFDLSDDGHRTRLLSYVWADQTDRLNRMRAALKIAREVTVEVDAAHAVEWLEQRLENARQGHAHVAFHSITWQYLSEGDQFRGKMIIENAGLRSSWDAPLFLLSMEADGDSPGASLRLRAWPGGEERELARVDFHGRWIAWKGVDHEQ
ncbi:MAG: DUF2332 family protein [Hyphomicrobiales bacterium]|nr:DUF2332 family protein [Hyphomicrobiales bacterium]MCP4998193.1 DUF2332 family protein [Hyphomicrobiales bacterium]